ncbi:thiamine pyrophosphate-binding protein [Derxia lacustris]|uniref:thiamine pyrophosphate-binding protein n=1 Tax=Derxia lacustris TaxID=764842 RepID=UPI000A16FE32|nr:thiamine pyrophosphate-binding protein [Derxia lacustris]
MLKSNLLPPRLFEREFRAGRPTGNTGRARLQAAAASATGETVATYLNKRLAEIGCKHVFAIPGDYIAPWVETLDGPDNAGLVRVHPNNEMVAAYAADGYGRAANGSTVGCMAFTYGVGAMNALQAVAGAHVEYVPVVLVNGSPSPAQFNSQRDQGVLWHHMFDGSYTDLRLFREVTAMAVRLDNPAYAPDLIDAALTACITQSRPVYIEIAVGMENYDCQPVASRPRLKPAPLPQSASSLDEALGMVMQVLVGAKRLVVLGGVEIARAGLQDAFATLVQKLGAPYVSDLLGKSLLSEYRDDINFSGVYNGRNSQQNVQDLMRGADIILALGVHETDFNFSGVASTDYAPGSAPGLPLPLVGQIEARLGAVLINSTASPTLEGELYWGDIQLGPFIAALTQAVAALPGGALPNAAGFPRLVGSPWDIPPPSSFAPEAQITWDSFKSALQHDYLDSFDESQAPALLADTGATFYSLNNLKVPRNGYIAQLSWGAIGYSPGAIGGVQLALRARGDNRRVISISGDGAFAESVNALGTLAELGLDCVVFVMANGVFAIEQFLINPQAFAPGSGVQFSALTQVAQTSLWNWRALAAGFGGVGYEVTTNAELQQVLAELRERRPDPVPAHGPCSGSAAGPGCCDFAPAAGVQPRRSTFTLVAVRNVCNDLPSNMRWKLQQS